MRYPVQRRCLHSMWPALLAAILVLSLPARAHAVIYWPERDGWGGFGASIGRASLDGAHVQPAFLSTSAEGVAVDGQHLYWGAWPPMRAGLAGDDPERITEGQEFGYRSIAVTPTAIYLGSGSRITKVPRDGSPASDIVTGQNAVCGLTVADGRLYWADVNRGVIARIDTDGSDLRSEFIRTDFGPCGVAVADGHVYWGNYWDDGTEIGRADLDGGNADQDFISGVVRPCALDVHGSHLYWAEELGNIGRAALDGSQIDRAFISTSAGCGLAIDDIPEVSSTVLTAAPENLVYGTEVRYTATVTAPGAPPTGAVSFGLEGMDATLDVGLGADGTAGVEPLFWMNPGDVVTAIYGGDDTHAPSMAKLREIVAPADTAIDMEVAPDPMVVGRTSRVTFTVRNIASTPIPTGSLFVRVGAASGWFELDDNGQVILDVTPEEAGTYEVTGSYADGLDPHHFQWSLLTRYETVAPAPAAAPVPAPAAPVLRPAGPAPTVALVAGQSRASVRRHGLLVRAGCATGCRIRARLLADAPTAKRLSLPRSRQGMVAERSQTLTSAGTTTVTLLPTRAVRRLLGRTARTRLRLELRATGATVTQTIARTLTLDAQKARLSSP